MEEQLLLFEPTPEEALKKEVKVIIKQEILKYGKGQWGTIGELKKEIKDLKSKIDFLESHICKTGLFL